MSAGGEIIIRNALATAASHDDVLNMLAESKRERLRGLLSRGAASWSAADCHFVTRCIGETIDTWDAE